LSNRLSDPCWRQCGRPRTGVWSRCRAAHWASLRRARPIRASIVPSLRSTDVSGPASRSGSAHFAHRPVSALGRPLPVLPSFLTPTGPSAEGSTLSPKRKPSTWLPRKRRRPRIRRWIHRHRFCLDNPSMRIKSLWLGTRTRKLLAANSGSMISP